MKRHLLISTLLLTIVSFGQTKVETVDWLNDMFSTTNMYNRFGSNCGDHMQFNYDGTFKMTIKCDYKPNPQLPFTNYESFVIVDGNLKNFSPNAKPINDNGKWVISIPCTNSDCFSVQIIRTGVGRPHFDKLVYSELDDEDTANRICKAINHLIVLCGGKKSPF